MSDAASQTPPGSSQAPANSRPAYSLLETQECVKVSVFRPDNSGGLMDIYLFNADAKDWEIVTDTKVSAQLRAGIDRFEAIVRKDPKQAAILKSRSDNTIDGKPNPDPAAVATGEAQGKQGAPAGQPPVQEKTATPTPVVQKATREGDLLKTSTTQPRIAT